ncbi:Pyridoxal-5'-phosphate-dependent enzyme family protein [Perilla frutescens var. hirtella]|uniref:Tryptophan synthase n=1 Tax=Perilla frutescens var. hirtella TaxID=608512 RepID=A0AAD4JDF5_PERFH|nr:Pyridoxal-5'-phosphate-dependent enzyme family protein [Perilla frutescens var. frutescens]KAH6792808.1 Pyridoxal-5'-phosphate-dependent enzyme family protein [Perilla frutescens var. hirtella]KAH6831394.1 Pyridoxal-5'-phosphate-dependent enzyme family protein [Perilla frutescens var. hirtella]
MVEEKCLTVCSVETRSAKTTHHDLLQLIDKTEESLFRTGKFGRFGGIFVPETLVTCLNMLVAEFNLILHDPHFQGELEIALRDYVGRETPLYFAERLTDHFKNSEGEGPQIYLKREDLNHGGAHKINNAIAQAMLAKRMGRKCVVAATGAGQHGVATAAVCAKLALECTIFMGHVDMERQSSNVRLMMHLGAQVKSVEGAFKDATSQAIREWVGDLDNNYYLAGTAVGPHPCPAMVREFQSIIGKETRRQAMDKWGGKPDVLVACVGSGSNALGIFHEFLRDEDVRLIGVEAAGTGTGIHHSATLAKGQIGVYHGAMTYLLQDDHGQIIAPHSIGVGLEYPGVSPELSFLRDIGRAEFHTVTDEEALDAYLLLCRLEGIFPALEAAHALAHLAKLCPTLPNGAKVVVNCSGRGDKDAETVLKYQQQKDGATLTNY